MVIGGVSDRLKVKPGDYVSLRPCAEDAENKTFLGVFVGVLPMEFFPGVVNNNPAIYVPKLDRVVFGFESWWGRVNSPEECKKITDGDIEEIWYVKAVGGKVIEGTSTIVWRDENEPEADA